MNSKDLWWDFYQLFVWILANPNAITVLRQQVHFFRMINIFMFLFLFLAQLVQGSGIMWKSYSFPVFLLTESGSKTLQEVLLGTLMFLYLQKYWWFIVLWECSESVNWSVSRLSNSRLCTDLFRFQRLKL